MNNSSECSHTGGAVVDSKTGTTTQDHNMPNQSPTAPKWSPAARQVMEVFFAETVGTGMLLFFGCMGLVSWIEDGSLPPLQGATVFAVVVTTIIQIFGHISAAHLNPAVTIAFLVMGKITPTLAVVYIVAECIGAVLGYGLLTTMTPAEILNVNGNRLCCTVPHDSLSDLQALMIEFFATCFLVMVVCACIDSRNANKADSTPLKFGCTILALSIAVGPYTGASMNPARSMAPALWTGVWTRQWVYWLGPCFGGFASAIFYLAIFHKDKEHDSTHHEEEPLQQIKVNGPVTEKREKEQGR